MAMPTNKANTGTPGSALDKANTGFTLEAMAGWAFIFASLVVASDFPGVGDLAAAFALLILIATALGFGPAAFDNISKLFTRS